MTFHELISKKFKKSNTLNDYLSVKKGFLYYKEIKLMSLVEKFKTPLEVAYTDMINEKVSSLKKIFSTAIKKNNYGSKYIYAYATKANYYSEAVTTALNYADAIETSSSYDLDIVENLYKRKIITNKTMVICNGFKHDRYFKQITRLKKKGLNIFPVLENLEEVDLFIEKTKLKFNVGIRINIDEEKITTFETGERIGSEVESRFGLSFQEVIDSAKKIKESKHLQFTMLHFHLGGTITNINKFVSFTGNIYKNNFIKLQKENSKLAYFDFGGGLPTQYSLDFNFDYELFANKLIKKIKSISTAQKVNPPILIGEHGRYTVNDHGFSLFKIDIVKKTKQPNTFWYLINSSLMNFLPDSWALGQDFIVLPLSGWDKTYSKVKLGGITCDPDDTYYKNEKDNYIYLPKKEKDEELYIGIFGTGSYQEMISGVGGVHHCLTPEGTELIIHKKKNKLFFNKITKLQTPEKVLKILDYHRHHNLKKYKKL